ncbi:MAG: hypothetical protein HY231_03805 [Acidobacteria bacterium]|nr:hypothetical protein [Acidobacteriota bacterium]
MIEPQLVEVWFNHSKREPQRQRLIGVVQSEIRQSRAKKKKFGVPPEGGRFALRNLPPEGGTPNPLLFLSPR